LVLVDSNVLLDVLQDDARWADWSQSQLETLGLVDRLCINAIVYAEVSIGFSRIEDLDRALADAGLAVEEMPRAALFLAGKVFRASRRGRSGGILPDYLIGAHASVCGWTLLTRDQRLVAAFPRLKAITPARD
jgi:predicted nucleic acid-binding protein